MDWERMDRKDAREFYERLKNDKSFVQELSVSLSNPDFGEPYITIRNKLKKRLAEAIEKTNNHEHATRSAEYSVDLDMAEEIYRIMFDYGLSVRDAADERVWIYLSVKVIPDVILERWRWSEKKLAHEDRFYANSRRIYPSMLWWYYYISYQDSSLDPVTDTRKILINNQSDDISQLVERAGAGGYPIRLYKQIMTEYGKRLIDGRKPDNLLSRVLKLNIIQMQSLEPELMYDGIESYVCDLFDRVE